MIVEPGFSPSTPTGPAGGIGPAAAREMGGAGLAATARLDGILSFGRQLSSAKALLDIVRQVLDDISVMVDEASRILGVLSEPGLPASSWDAATLRYQHAVHEVVGLLAASRNVGQMLLQGEDGQGLVATGLQRMERIAALLPRVPADHHAAHQAAENFAPVQRSLEEARSRLEEAHRSVEAQLAMALERMDDESAALGAMEDTDVLKEAARLQALQIRQQLAGHAIGLGALVPRCLQDLRHL